MKIISAATLIDNRITSANGPAPCPDEAVWQSETFHNLDGMKADEHATLSDSFSRSCNTAFVKYADSVRVDSLTKEAEDRFGLGRDNWKVGIPSFDGSVPASGGPDTAADMIGQGQVQLSPLNLASVTATASSHRTAVATAAARIHSGAVRSVSATRARTTGERTAKAVARAALPRSHAAGTARPCDAPAPPS